MRTSLFRLNAFALLVLLGFSSSARAELRGTRWDIFDKNFTVGSGDYIQMTGDGNGDSFRLNNGNFYHNDSTMDFWGNAQIGTNWWANFYQNGGQMNVGGYLSIARYGGSGALIVNGGLVNSYNQAIIVGEVGTGGLEINGGRAYSNQGVTLGANGGSTGNLSLNGGTLEAGAIWKGGGTGNLSFNGGTLKATRGELNFISGLNLANIGGNGAVIDNNGKEIGINQALTGSGSGSVKFDGSGRTTLRQNNTYTGDTLVRGGTLVVDTGGSIASSSTIISSGATVTGAGSIAALTVESGGVVKITTASTSTTSTSTTSTSSATAWYTGGSINFKSDSIIDVTGLTLSQQPYVLIRGSSVTGIPILQGATGFTVSNTDNNSITLTPIPAYTYTIADGQATITKYNGTDVDVVIPTTIGGGTVTEIGNNAFQGKTSLTTVIIPNGVTRIGSYAFSGCISMASMTLPNSLRSIGDHAFENNGNLTAVTIPEGVTTIGSTAFAGCRKMALINLPSSLTAIGDRAFQSCDILNNVIIPRSVASLGENAFEQCGSLTSITLPSGLSKIESSTFWLCTNLTSITIPGSVNEIKFNAFLRCSKLASVYFLGNTRPSIGTDAFKDITSVAKGYYPATATPWSGITGLSLEPKVYNQLINGSFEDGPVLPSSEWLAVPQNDVLGWKTTAVNTTDPVNQYKIELWYSGFEGSFGNDGDILAELNYFASETLYQDVTMTVNSPVSYSFLHRGRSGTETIEFRIDRLVGGPGSALEANANFFNREVSTGNGAWVRYRGTPPGTVQAGRTYRFSYRSVIPATGGSGNLLDGASFEIDQDGDGLIDSVETNTDIYVSANNTGTDPSNPDSDNDGLKDGEEVITYETNPNIRDTDGDFAPDGVEVTAGTNPKQNSSLPKPVITSQPVSITNTAGGSATFSVTATNPAGVPSGLTYQWKKSTNIISGQTNQTLNLAPLTVLQSGSYSVVVANIYGSTNSTVATLTVTKADPIITAPTATPIVYGQTLAFSILSGGVASVEGEFAWTSPSTLPNAGPATSSVTFTPKDTANYNTATTDVSVTVNQALISSGFSHTLYLGAGATTVTAWGLNTDGRLGVGDMDSPVNWAEAVQGIPLGYTVTGLAAGGTHSLILANGKVYAAGSDRFGQLGQGGTNRVNRSSFTNVFGSPSNPVAAVSAGGNHSLAVTESGKVFACGDNTYGQLGNSELTSSPTWIEVSFKDPITGLSPEIVSVVAGADHNLAVDEGGGVWVWGRNNYGQLGIGKRSVAERTPSKLNLGKIDDVDVVAESVAAGFSHSLILTTDGKVLGFGRNNSGQAGDPGQIAGVATTSVVTTPKLIPDLSGIRLISAGTDSSFAINQLGRLYSWGYNSYGELLLGYSSPSSSPAVYGPRLSTIATNVFNVSGGGYSSLAWGVQGLVFGGRNDVGQSGSGPDPGEVVGDYTYMGESLTLTNLTMDLAGTTETLDLAGTTKTLYDRIFVGDGAVTLNGIVNLMFVGTYTGPVYGSPQTFDLIWATNGITLDTGYKLAVNQPGYLVESKIVGDVGKEQVLQATVRAVESNEYLDALVASTRPSLDKVQSISYSRATSGTGVSTLSVSPSPEAVRMEMVYSYQRPTGGVTIGSEYFVNGFTYRVEYTASLQLGLVDWNPAVVTGTTITPLGNGDERATLRISASGSAGFLQLELEKPQATPSN